MSITTQRSDDVRSSGGSERLGSDHRSWWSRQSTLLKHWSIVYVPTFVLLGTVLVLGRLNRIRLGTLTRDPSAVLNGPFYIGFLSQVGALVWCTTAAICFFSAAMLSQRDRSARIVQFLVASGLITMMLLVDDLFQLHETVAELSLGVSEHVVYGLYVLITAGYLVRFRQTIRRTQYWPLVLCALWFAGSILIDLLPNESQWSYFVEDGLKFCGIVTWCAYFVQLCSEEFNRT